MFETSMRYVTGGLDEPLIFRRYAEQVQSIPLIFHYKRKKNFKAFFGRLLYSFPKINSGWNNLEINGICPVLKKWEKRGFISMKRHSRPTFFN